ncbi:polycystic kidney disease protein 1-like 3 [Gopherus flavomarginatus]|uniref:polycystic kidney disease protein 1-like 3 n=1 Tax=Gopherus flavomarginatus TaxID=286002 RepID=UPI0021CC4D1B|nr:polycystic kidney disease protein 1-like 3 [Gopherus flavomarginatus]
MGDICYKFIRLRDSFWGAQAWCQANGGRLAHSWNPETQALLNHCLVEGEKWWVGLREHPGFSAHRADAAVTPFPAGCSYITRDSGTISSRRDTCVQELYFICQFTPQQPSNQLPSALGSKETGWAEKPGPLPPGDSRSPRRRHGADWGDRERNLTRGHQAGRRDRHRHQARCGDRHRHQTHRGDRHRHHTCRTDRHRHQTGCGDRHRHQTHRGDRHRHHTCRADRHRHQTRRGDRHRHQTGRGDRHRHQTGCGDRHRHQTHCGDRHRHHTCRADRHRHQTRRGDRHRHQAGCGDRHRHQTGWGDRHRHQTSHGNRQRHQTHCGHRHRHHTHCADGHRHQTSHGDRHRHQTGRRDRHRHHTHRWDWHRHQTGRGDRHRQQTSCRDQHRHQTSCGDRHRHQAGRWAPRAAQRRSHGLAGTVTTLQDPNLDPFTVNSWTLLQEASSDRALQAMEDTMRQFNQAIRTIHHLPALQRACHTLQRLTEGTSLLSEAAQREASESLLFLSTQLLQAPLPSNSSGSAARTPAATSLFQSFSHLLTAMDSSAPTSHWARNQLTEALENTMAALTGIQTVLWEGSCAVESSVTVTSPVASTMLSSRNASTLPQSSYHLAQPVPLTLAFPSASAWGVLLSKHPRVQVRVTVLAVNPFKHLDRKEIRSVGYIFLTANKESIQVQDFPEDIEIRLWRDESTETSPTGLNISTEEFVIKVNITSMEDALILRVLPDIPLPIELYLGYQHPVNGSHSLLNTTLPTGHGQHSGDNYTWVLRPAMLQLGPGPYHVTAMVRQSPEQELPSHVTYTITTIATQCHFWDHRRKAWRQDGCQVGPQSTVSSIQCLCNHLSVFGSSFFVVPRTVNIQDTGKLLSKVASNPIGVALLASLLVLHGVVGVWAWRRDQVDVRKVKVTVLADSDPRAHVRYVVQVFTGYRRGAATTAKVVLTLYGTEGRSEPHCLRDPHKPVFERGGLDVFLVTTWSSLGELHNIRLWHDNSGSSPSWYVRQVVVSDVTARRKWHFLCSAWLAADLGDCQLDRVFPAASRSELLSSRHLFCSELVEKVTHDHLWLSVLTHCPWDPFTRLQRLACCLTLLLCTMVINIMFWRDPLEAGNQAALQPGRVLFTWQELVTSVQTALILLPINLVVGQIFQLVPPQELPLPPTGIRLPRASAPPQEASSLKRITQELKATVGFLSRTKLCLEHEALPQEMDSVPELVRSLCCLVGSHLRRGVEPAEPCLVNGTDTNGLLLGATPLCLPGPMERAPGFCAGRCECGGLARDDRTNAASPALSETYHHLSSHLSHVLGPLLAQLRALDLSKLCNPHDYLQAAGQLQSLLEQLEQPGPCQEPGLARGRRSFPISEPRGQKATIPFQLQREALFICWVTVAATSLASAYFTILLSLQLDRQRATSWVVSMLLSLLQNIFIMQPLKVAGLTLLFSLVLKRMLWQDKGKEQQLQRSLALLARCPYLELPGTRDWNDPVYHPPCPRPAPPRRRRTWKKKQLYTQLGEIVAQLVLLASLTVVCYTERSPHELYFNEAIRKSITPNFHCIRGLGDFYGWAHGTLLPSLDGPHPGFISDGNALLLGSVRLRQLRPQPQQQLCSCRQQDAGGHGPGWGPPGHSRGAQDSIWVNHGAESLGEYPVWGQLSLYPGGGYLAHLGTNSSHAHSVLQYLERSRWLDGCSCAIFVEFTVYNANVNLFCVVTLLLETPGTGAFLPSAELQSIRLYSSSGLTQLTCAQGIYVLLLLFYTWVQGRRLKQQKWRYFGSQRNVLDISIIFISLAAFGVYIKCRLLQKSVMEKYHQDRSRFVSFYEIAQVASALTYLLAFLVALAMGKLWNLLRLNPRMHLISSTLRRAWQEVLGFLLMLLVLLAGYSMACNLLFGWSIANYKTFFSSSVTIVGLLIGIFNYDMVINLDPVLGSLLITTSVISMLYVVINLFVSGLLTTFSEERASARVGTDLGLHTQALPQACGGWAGGSLTQKQAEGLHSAQLAPSTQRSSARTGTWPCLCLLC